MNKIENFNWIEIQNFYDSGHTLEDVYRKFSIGNKLLNRAKQNNLFRMRTKEDQQILAKSGSIILESRKDRLATVAELYNLGLSQRDIFKKGYTFSEYVDARNLGIFIPRSNSQACKNYRIQNGPLQNSMGIEARQALSLRQSTNNSGGKCKWFEVNGQKVQGTWERNIALKLTELNIEWYKLKVNADVWKYTLDSKIKSYTPDFYLSSLDLYLEIKGFWWGNDKNKMQAVREQHSDKNLIIIEKDSYEKILRGELVW